MRSVFILLLCLSIFSYGRSYHKDTTYKITTSYHSTSKSSKSKTTISKKHHKDYRFNCARDSKGHIKRSSKARDDFKKAHPCPGTGKSSGPCKGYVIDHIKPLKRGGADDPSNMQWQTEKAAKEKDKVE